ncbi:MAG: hypothetical protein ACOCSD_07275 [Halolamina sp.]
MASATEDAADSDSDTDAAVRRAVRDEIRGAVRALTQIGGGMLFGFFALPTLAGALLVLGAPIGVVLLVTLATLCALVAYAWAFPPFN